jgi:hypothetical protein
VRQGAGESNPNRIIGPARHRTHGLRIAVGLGDGRGPNAGHSQHATTPPHSTWRDFDHSSSTATAICIQDLTGDSSSYLRRCRTNRHHGVHLLPPPFHLLTNTPPELRSKAIHLLARDQRPPAQVPPGDIARQHPASRHLYVCLSRQAAPTSPHLSTSNPFLTPPLKEHPHQPANP